MKILYGVQGTGNGHISRARAMQQHFCDAGVEVDYLFSGRAKQDYFGMEYFGDWQCRQGLSFVSERGKIKLLTTARRNNLLQLIRDIRSLDLSNYDLIVSDFEPITAWAAKRQKVPCITVGHQYAFQYDIPLEGDSWLSRAIINNFAPGDLQLGLHWHHFDQPILPPIIDLDHQPVVSTGPVLVYLGFEAPEVVIPVLQSVAHIDFVYYGNFPEPSRLKNVKLQPLSVEGFKTDLHRCSGVICNAGFELASEALQLKKPILVKPLHGQMEQLSNALALDELQLGHRMAAVSADAIVNWIENQRKTDCQYPNVAKAIVQWITDAQRCTVDALSTKLWQQTKFNTR